MKRVRGQRPCGGVGEGSMEWDQWSHGAPWEGRRGREPEGAPWSGKGGGGGAGRAEGAERAERAEGAGRAERAGMHWDPLSADRVQSREAMGAGAGWDHGAMGHEPLRVRGMGP